MIAKTKTSIQTSFLFLSCFFLCLVANGQSKEAAVKKAYLQVEAGPTTHNGVFAGFGVQAVFKKNWTAGFSYQSIEMDPNNLPSDYTSGYGLLIWEESPVIHSNVYNFTAGKYIKTGRKTWFTTEVGISIVNGQEMSYTKQPVEDYIIYYTSNYATKTEDKTTVGGILKADFNWAILPYVGLGAGFFGNFSSIQSPIGFQVKLIAGWLNSKKKKDETTN